MFDKRKVWGCLSAGRGNVYGSATVHFKEAVIYHPAYIAFKITDTIILSLEVEVPYLQHQVKSSHMRQNKDQRLLHVHSASNIKNLIMNVNACSL